MARLASENTPEKFLKLSGQTVSKVVTVWSAAESDFGFETILFIDAADIPRTAVLLGEAHGHKLVVRRGWETFDPLVPPTT